MMADFEADTRAYVEKRFPRTSRAEREKIVRDWLAKEVSADGIAADFERRARPLAGLKVLDAGCGNGGISVAFANRGALVEGVDIEEALVALARARASRQGSRARFTWYEGTTLPFSDSFFDAALSVSVLEHVGDPTRYLAEILRVLKHGGQLYLAFPNRLWPKETHTGLWGLSYLPLPLARFYVYMRGRNPLEDNGLHFHSFWAVRRFICASASPGRTWVIQDEQGKSISILKRCLKWMLRVLRIPHQALLPHVMLILQTTEVNHHEI